MSYYSQKLAGERLRRVYEIAPPRTVQYLQAEIDHVISGLIGNESLLELGCGYGRVMLQVSPHVRQVTGIDTAAESIELGRRLTVDIPHCRLVEMDATELTFADSSFDTVVCIQNGICAFRVDQVRLMNEALRVTRPGGKVILSTYAAEFWTERLHWFELQAREDLVGPIDYEQCGNRIIVCTDGFRSGSMTADDFARLGELIGICVRIEEVDNSSLFCTFVKPHVD